MKEKLIPESIRPAFEGEITDICYIVLLSLSQADWAGAQSKGQHSRIFGEIEDRFEDLRTSINTIQTLWPENKTKLKNFTNLSQVMPNWLSNWRAWKEFIDLHGAEVGNSLAARKAYQTYVESNRKYVTQIYYETEQAASELSSAGLDFHHIVAESIERINNSIATLDARKATQALLDEVVRNGFFTPNEVIEQLAKILELSSSEIDIDSFNIGQCAQALSWGRLAGI